MSQPTISAVAILISTALFAAEPNRVRADDADSLETIQVAVYVGDGTGKSRNNLLSALKRHPGVQVEQLSAKEIQSGRLDGFDVVIFPGGSGSKQGRGLGKDGREKVRNFIESGGGYIGICAGAYLATNDYSWSLGILDAQVVDKKHWARGFGDVQLRLTETGQRVLNVEDDSVTVYYHQGPLLAPNDDPEVPDYQVLSKFETEVTKPSVPGGVMPGKAAIVVGRFGSGRVCCFSPHPEKTDGLESFIYRGVLWTVEETTQGSDP